MKCIEDGPIEMHTHQGSLWICFLLNKEFEINLLQHSLKNSSNMWLLTAIVIGADAVQSNLI